MLPEQAMSKALADPAITADDLSKIVATGKNSFRLPNGKEYEVKAPAIPEDERGKHESLLPPIKVLPHCHCSAISVLLFSVRGPT